MNRLFVLLFVSASIFAQDNTPLDPPYQSSVRVKTRPMMDRFFNWDTRELFARRTTKNDVLSLIEKQTPVRSQLNRGTCSIFSATALLESLLVIHKNADALKTDLSEEWLEYIKAAETGMDGSMSTVNIGLFNRFGMPNEKTLPYIGETWEKLEDSVLAQERCKDLKRNKLKKCLIGHRNPDLLSASDEELSQEGGKLYDPELLAARQEASEFRDRQLSDSAESRFVWSEDEVKKLLDAGVPLLLDLDFFYGAWNHREAMTLGMNRNMEHWNLGVVGYPEMGSKDFQLSKKKPAGHSIVLVGYNEDEEIIVENEMSDGTMKEFRYKGVYYFKNSWGTDRLGMNAEIEGQKVPGYGRITQKYAHDHGTFYVWKWKP